MSIRILTLATAAAITLEGSIVRRQVRLVKVRKATHQTRRGFPMRLIAFILSSAIAALALVTLIASPTFARPAARASTQAEFVFPTDQQLCQSGRTDFCHWRGYPLWQWYSGA
jgi:hypothetical protein